MYNPKEVFTKQGLEEHAFQIRSLEKALDHLMNNADDLHIGALDSRQEELLYEFRELVQSGVFLNGDGEEL